MIWYDMVWYDTHINVNMIINTEEEHEHKQEEEDCKRLECLILNKRLNE